MLKSEQISQNASFMH